MVSITLDTRCSLNIRQRAATIVQCSVLYDVMLLEDIIHISVFLPKYKFNDIQMYLTEKGQSFFLPYDRYNYFII